MDLGTRVRSAGARLRDKPQALLVAVLFTVGEALLLLPLLLVLAVPSTGNVVKIGLVLLVALVPPASVLLPLFSPVLYGVFRDEGPRTSRDAIGSIVDEARDYAGSLFRGAIGAQFAAGLIAVAGFALVFPAITAFQAYMQVGGLLTRSSPSNLLVVFVGVPLATRSLGTAFVRFYDVSILYGGERPRKAWRSSFRFTLARPRSLLGYWIVQTMLALLPLVVAFLLTRLVYLTIGTEPVNGVPAALLTFGGGFLVLWVVSHGFRAAYHVTFYEKVVAPATTSTGAEALSDTSLLRRLFRSRRRVAMVTLLVSAALVGTTAVRVNDVQPGAAEYGDAPSATALNDSATADELYDVAADRTAVADKRVHRTVYEAAGSEASETITSQQQFAFDHEHHQYEIVYRYPDQSGELETTLDVYAADGTVAYREGPPSNPSDVRHAIGGRQAGEWTVAAAPGYWLLDPQSQDSGGLTASSGWHVVSRNESTVVLGMDDERRLVDAFRQFSDARNYSAESHARAWIDRDSATIQRLAVRQRFSRLVGENGTETVDRWTITRFEGVGETDVRRPAGIGGQGPFEMLWDAVYY